MMRLRPMRCAAVHQHLLSYMAGEGHPSLRRRIAHHLQACDACYARYQREAALTRELRAALTPAASPPADLGRVWQGIQWELRQPAQPTLPMRYALVAVALTLMLLVPMTFDRGGKVWATPPTPPSPQTDLMVERATPAAPVMLASTVNVVEVNTPVSTPDASYRADTVRLISITTP
jgi:anti-sigma factor RsiW